LNNHAYDNDKVTVINMDAWKFIEKSNTLYDVIIIDLPDPNNISLSRLYSQTFYRLLSNHLSRSGAMVTQATSPMFSREAFWCIEETMAKSNLYTLPYHTYIPSFGEWGFVLSSKLKLPLESIKPLQGLKFIDTKTMQRMKVFDKDISKPDIESNKLSSHKLIYYYDEGWKKWYE
jgi:spermidine synthase